MVQGLAFEPLEGEPPEDKLLDQLKTTTKDFAKRISEPTGSAKIATRHDTQTPQDDSTETQEGGQAKAQEVGLKQTGYRRPLTNTKYN